MSLLSLQTYEEPDTIRVAVSGELDLSSALTFEEELRHIENDCNPSTLVLDLRSLKFLDSTGLRLILSAHARAIKGGWRLAIVQGGETVQRIFRLTGVLERLDIVQDCPAGASTPASS